MVNSHDTSLNRSADSSLFNLFLLSKLLLEAALGQRDVLSRIVEGKLRKFVLEWMHRMAAFTMRVKLPVGPERE
jgi:hypothetical protein